MMRPARRPAKRTRNPAKRRPALIKHGPRVYSTADGLVMVSYYCKADGDDFRGWVVERASDRAISDPIATKREALRIAEEMYAEVPQHTRDFWRELAEDNARRRARKTENPGHHARRTPRKKPNR